MPGVNKKATPINRVDFSGRAKDEAAEPIIETLHELLKNFSRMKRRADKLQHLIESMVKPDLTGIRFLR